MEKRLIVEIPLTDGTVELASPPRSDDDTPTGSLVSYVAPFDGGAIMDGEVFRLPNHYDGYDAIMGDMFWRRMAFGFRNPPLWYVIDIETDDLGGDITHIGISLVKPSVPKAEETEHLSVSFVLTPDDDTVIPRPSEMLAVGCGWNLSYDLPILNKRFGWGYVKTQNFRYGDKVEPIEVLYSGDEWVDLMLLVKKWDVLAAVSYTHLTLPTIYSV